jgi:anti-anti-sigma factor
MDGEDPNLTDRRMAEAPPNLLSVEVVMDREGASVLVVGELDISTGGYLLDALRPLRIKGPREVVLECARLSFLDVGGISILLEIQRELTESGRQFTLRSLRPNLRRVLEMVDVTGALEVVD